MSTSEAFVRVAIIMAGGSGERFWPVSRRDRPKQLLRLTSPTDTMLGEAVSRISPLIPPGGKILLFRDKVRSFPFKVAFI